MKRTSIDTETLELILQTPDDIRRQLDRMLPTDRAEVSGEWLALVASASSPDPWIHGFAVVRREDNVIVGNCGFKGPPTADGIVEIAYGVAPEYQGNGYATQAARALVGFARASGMVRIIRAHTVAEDNVSTRVLRKCGFRRMGQVEDPDDGVVWRWEYPDDAA
jgi:[ribosomal protein S5]-alanine N-acetyltransferase